MFIYRLWHRTNCTCPSNLHYPINQHSLLLTFCAYLPTLPSPLPLRAIRIFFISSFLAPYNLCSLLAAFPLIPALQIPELCFCIENAPSHLHYPQTSDVSFAPKIGASS